MMYLAFHKTRGVQAMRVLGESLEMECADALVGLEVFEILEVVRLIGVRFGDLEGAGVGSCGRVWFDGLDSFSCFGDDTVLLG